MTALLLSKVNSLLGNSVLSSNLSSSLTEDNAFTNNYSRRRFWSNVGRLIIYHERSSRYADDEDNYPNHLRLMCSLLNTAPSNVIMTSEDLWIEPNYEHFVVLLDTLENSVVAGSNTDHYDEAQGEWILYYLVGMPIVVCHEVLGIHIYISSSNLLSFLDTVAKINIKSGVLAL